MFRNLSRHFGINNSWKSERSWLSISNAQLSTEGWQVAKFIPHLSFSPRCLSIAPSLCDKEWQGREYTMLLTRITKISEMLVKTKQTCSRLNDAWETYRYNNYREVGLKLLYRFRNRRDHYKRRKRCSQNQDFRLFAVVRIILSLTMCDRNW